MHVYTAWQKYAVLHLTVSLHFRQTLSNHASKPRPLKSVFRHQNRSVSVFARHWTPKTASQVRSSCRDHSPDPQSYLHTYLPLISLGLKCPKEIRHLNTFLELSQSPFWKIRILSMPKYGLKSLHHSGSKMLPIIYDRNKNFLEENLNISTQSKLVPDVKESPLHLHCTLCFLSICTNVNLYDSLGIRGKHGLLCLLPKWEM